MSEARKKADDFHALHVPGRPFVLFNIWDAGTAKTVAAADSRAIATGSWSVAAANGFKDGEDVPLDLAIDNLARIARATALPVSIDIESGYGTTADAVGHTIARTIEAGAIGCNLEDSFPKWQVARHRRAGGASQHGAPGSRCGRLSLLHQCPHRRLLPGSSARTCRSDARGHDRARPRLCRCRRRRALRSRSRRRGDHGAPRPRVSPAREHHGRRSNAGPRRARRGRRCPCQPRTEAVFGGDGEAGSARPGGNGGTSKGQFCPRAGKTVQFGATED